MTTRENPSSVAPPGERFPEEYAIYVEKYRKYEPPFSGIPGRPETQLVNWSFTSIRRELLKLSPGGLNKLPTLKGARAGYRLAKVHNPAFRKRDNPSIVEYEKNKKFIAEQCRYDPNDEDHLKSLDNSVHSKLNPNSQGLKCFDDMAGWELLAVGSNMGLFVVGQPAMITPSIENASYFIAFIIATMIDLSENIKDPDNPKPTELKKLFNKACSIAREEFLVGLKGSWFHGVVDSMSDEKSSGRLGPSTITGPSPRRQIGASTTSRPSPRPRQQTPPTFATSNVGTSTPSQRKKSARPSTPASNNSHATNLALMESPAIMKALEVADKASAANAMFQQSFNSFTDQAFTLMNNHQENIRLFGTASHRILDAAGLPPQGTQGVAQPTVQGNGTEEESDYPEDEDPHWDDDEEQEGVGSDSKPPAVDPEVSPVPTAGGKENVRGSAKKKHTKRAFGLPPKSPRKTPPSTTTPKKGNSKSAGATKTRKRQLDRIEEEEENVGFAGIAACTGTESPYNTRRSSRRKA